MVVSEVGWVCVCIEGFYPSFLSVSHNLSLQVFGDVRFSGSVVTFWVFSLFGCTILFPCVCLFNNNSITQLYSSISRRTLCVSAAAAAKMANFLLFRTADSYDYDN